MVDVTLWLLRVFYYIGYRVMLKVDINHLRSFGNISAIFQNGNFCVLKCAQSDALNVPS